MHVWLNQELASTFEVLAARTYKKAGGPFADVASSVSFVEVEAALPLSF